MAIRLQYLRIEWKRACCAAGHMVGSLLLMTAIMLASTAGAAFLLRHAAGDLVPVRIGIVRLGDHPMVNQVIRILGGEESIHAVCRFTWVETEDEAIQEMEAGTINAAVILPETFVEDIMNGTNTPAIIYVPSDGIAASVVFEEMVNDGVSLIRSSEAGLYAAEAQAQITSARLTIHELDVLLTEMYIRAVMNRQGIYREETHSVLGLLTLPEYYTAAGLAMLLSGLGCSFGFFFTDQNREMERKLRAYGIGRTTHALTITVVMAFSLWLTILMILLPLLVILTSFRFLSLPVSYISAAFRLFPAALMAAAFDFFFYSLCRHSGRGELFLLLFTLFMIFACGCLLPTAFLPAVLERAGRFLPVSLWRSYFAQALFQEQLPVLTIARMAAPAAVFVSAGIFVDR